MSKGKMTVLSFTSYLVKRQNILQMTFVNRLSTKQCSKHHHAGGRSLHAGGIICLSDMQIFNSDTVSVETQPVSRLEWLWF